MDDSISRQAVLDEVIEQMSLALERVADAAKEFTKYLQNSKEIQRFIALTRSNNWLKMHGYPMRRRG